MRKPRHNGKKIFIAVAIIVVIAACIGGAAVLAGYKAYKSNTTASKSTAKNDSKGNTQTGGKTGLQSDSKNNSQNSNSQNNSKNGSQSSNSQNSSKSGSQSSNSQNSSKNQGSDSQNNSNPQSKTQSPSGGDGAGSSGSTYDPSIAEDNTAIHRYEFIISDCTWKEAFQDCINRGGYLVRINSSQEYDYIRKEISKRGMTNIFFRIGGRRDSGSKDYYWVNAENKLFGKKLNDADSWCSDEWKKGEPSFKDGNLEEKYMDLFFFDGEKRFVWNDVPDNMLAADADYSGRLGYICEYEK